MTAQYQNRLALSLREVCSLLGVTYPHLYRMAREKKIPTFRLGTKILVPTEYIDSLIDGAYDAEMDGSGD